MIGSALGSVVNANTIVSLFVAYHSASRREQCVALQPPQSIESLTLLTVRVAALDGVGRARTASRTSRGVTLRTCGCIGLPGKERRF